MIKRRLALFICLAALVPSALAGSLYSSPSQAGALATSVIIKGEGLYNLIVSVQFLTKPSNRATFNSIHYQEMIDRLNVEWRGIVLKRVLSSNSYRISDLASLKEKIDADLSQLVFTAKKKHGVNENTEVIYSIGSFYLLSPNKE
jgi:hypothetical protein